MTNLAESIHKPQQQRICDLAGLVSAEKRKPFDRSKLNALKQACLVALLCMAPGQAMQAQTFSVLHSFTGGPDGANPSAGLTMAGPGSFYGTASDGGSDGNGVVFKVARSGSGWVVTPLYSFQGSPNDGVLPLARVTIGPDGSLYGTTYRGGMGNCNCGIVFNLKPPAHASGSVLTNWSETVLLLFDSSNGANPGYGDLIFDQAGNLYGTTSGGCCFYANAFELAPSGGTWSENIVGYLGEGGLGAPSGLTFDHTGSLYGVAGGGELDQGVIFRLTLSGTQWNTYIVHNFGGDGEGFDPVGGLVFDQSGNLFGTTFGGGTNGGGGLVFEIPTSNGTFTPIYNFAGQGGPVASLTLDSQGNLYGTTSADGAYNRGSVFKLSGRGNSWTYTSLHDFTGGDDGGTPYSNVTIDANGNLYGTALNGGTYGDGVVWEITP